MPTIVTHAAVPLCLGLGLGARVIPPRLLFAGMALAMLPDADVLAFKFGIAYGNIFGSSRFTGERCFYFQEEVVVIPVSVCHSLYHFDLIVHPFQYAGI